MNASSALAPEQNSGMNYSTETLISLMGIADTTRRVQEELFPSEFGDEIERNSLNVADDGKTFTLRARGSFHMKNGQLRDHIEPGDVVKFDRDFNYMGIVR